MAGERTALVPCRNIEYAHSMFDKLPYVRPALVAAASALLISATPPSQEPGTGVLCLGTFIYFAEKTGQECRVGQDPEFQARIASYARRFDDYIIRNSGGDPAVLAKFKGSQNLTSADHSYICEGDVGSSYDHMKAMKAEVLDKAVDDLLARDGPPSFGDCV
jgi:hypothetical protein